jgi:hypothetical protein
VNGQSLRLLFVAVVLVAGGVVVAGSPLGGAERSIVHEDATAPAAEGITVITTQDAIRSNVRSAEIVAFRPDGSRLYYNDSFGTYFDVDPVPDTRTTVEYVATDFLNKSACHAARPCARNVIVRQNLSTGETDHLFSRVAPSVGDYRWHDADRINRTHYLVADLTDNRVFVVDLRTGLITWEWEAQNDYSLASGGTFGHSWTHLNDVEYLDDGRVMVSMRNHDQVVFLDPATGAITDRLGADDAHDTLYEQHNPDYIPPADGGPAVVVADSERDRVVEYQRASNGSWRRTWTWSDRTLLWPRDADRLPNGNTLVTDSNGDRVIEVNDAGEVVWRVDVGLPYEAERLATGDESAGGPSAVRADLTSRTAGGAGARAPSLRARVAGVVRSVAPTPVWRAVTFVTPYWVDAKVALALLVLCLTVVLWAVVEIRRSPYGVSVDLEVDVAVGRADERDGDGRERR